MLIITIIAFLGLAAGILLTFIAPEEIKPLKRYFQFSYRIILLLIVLALAYYKDLNLIQVVIILLILAAFTTIDSLKRLLFSLTPIIIYISKDNPAALVTTTLLVFILGTITSTFYAEIKNNKLINKRRFIFKIFYYNITFFVITAILIIYSFI